MLELSEIIFRSKHKLLVNSQHCFQLPYTFLITIADGDTIQKTLKKQAPSPKFHLHTHSHKESENCEETCESLDPSFVLENTTFQIGKSSAWESLNCALNVHELDRSIESLKILGII